ncbi:MAG: hypothetical protein LR015_09850 [Verrucomicrobia bacterium]|nr:hypothetical protein [Verrucomicrobiota bacterium]
MNKTLLLVICDFLLISILALVEFNPISIEAPSELAESAEVQQTQQADMVELLRLSLEDEAARREQMADDMARQAEQLDTTRSDLESTAAERERLAAERDRLTETVTQTQETLQLTAAEREELARRVAEEERRARQLQEELQQRIQRLQDAERTVANLEEQRRSLEQERQTLATDLRIRETERDMLQQNLVSARAEVEIVRLEKERLQEQTDRLSRDVAQLAETSVAVREEIRQAQPISSNVIFDEFRNNRVTLRFDFTTAGVLGGTRTRSMETQTVVIEHAGATYALFEAASSPFRPENLGSLRAIEGSIELGNLRFSIHEVLFLVSDPRIVAIQIPRSNVSSAGLRTFNLASDPLRFPDAVLISNTRGFYGESRFRLIPEVTGRINMQTRLTTRLFGEFAPTRGDFVFSRSMELMALMIDNEQAALIDTVVPLTQLRLGENFTAEEAQRVQTLVQRRLTGLP